MLKASSRKRFQLLLSSTVFLIAFTGFIGFALIAEKHVYQDTIKQTFKDNQKIGEVIIKLFQNKFDVLDNIADSLLIGNFQETCDGFDLPNKGYICFARNNGDLVAAPGLKPGTDYNLDKAQMVNADRTYFLSFSDIDPSGVFEGFYEYPSKSYSDVIVSMPVSNDFRIMVHQNNSELKNAAGRHFKRFLLLGFAGAFFCGGVVFLLSNRIISNYENKIEKQYGELKSAMKEIRQKNNHIVKQQVKISDSIRYAERIQKAVLPQKEELDAAFAEYFVFAKPKDIVSGDFYWLFQDDENRVFALGDCTGHGVPGAFMSLIANELLNNIVEAQGIRRPDLILNALHAAIRKTLKQENNDSRPDGMDIALIRLLDKEKELQIAGAKNSVYLVQKGLITEIKNDKMPIGGRERKLKRDFTYKSFPYGEVEKVYMGTDGYQDQFGGPEGKKYMKKHFRAFLQSVHHLPFAEQHEKLSQDFDEWTYAGKYPQIDDVSVFGLRLGG